jgi:hypothetical protein
MCYPPFLLLYPMSFSSKFYFILTSITLFDKVLGYKQDLKGKLLIYN